MKECPLCGETMTLSVRELPPVSGGSRPMVTRVREWICPECDYFEDADAIDE